MKKIALSLITIGAIALPIIALAQIGGTPPTNFVTDLTTLGNRIVAQVWIVFTIIAVICFVVAGVLFLTAAGNPEKVQQARTAFLWGVAGVVVGIVAYTIIAIVRTAVGA
jgi:hypothetical protein